jgi:hypothetical protein
MHLVAFVEYVSFHMSDHHHKYCYSTFAQIFNPQRIIRGINIIRAKC